MLASLKGYMIAAGAVLVIALLVGAYFKGRNDVIKLDGPKFAAIKQEGIDQQKEADRVDKANNFVTKEAYAELQAKLAGYSSNVDDLTKRLSDLQAAGKPVIVSGPMVATCQRTDAGPTGTAAASNTGPAEPATAEVYSSLPTEVLRDDLTLALQNIDALIVIAEAADKVQR